MSRCTHATGLSVALTLMCALAACSPSTPSSTPTTSATPSATSSTAAERTWHLVALGDSVPFGANCHCRPYPPLSAEDLSARTRRVVDATNDSVGGATTTTVLRQLRESENVIDDVRQADIVEIEIGANDVAHSDQCGSNAACYAPKLPSLKANLDEIIARVRELTAGHPVLVVLMDYWSVWLGGSYAAEKGQAYVDAAAEVTDQVNTAITSTASTTKSAYVDLRAAFKGPNYTYDETHYLSDDGDHPNAAGHQQIASAAAVTIVNTLHL